MLFVVFAVVSGGGGGGGSAAVCSVHQRGRKPGDA